MQDTFLEPMEVSAVNVLSLCQQKQDLPTLLGSVQGSAQTLPHSVTFAKDLIVCTSEYLGL